MENTITTHRLDSKKELHERLKGSASNYPAATQLLQALMELPANITLAEEILQQHVLNENEISTIGFVYSYFCFNTHYDFYDDDLTPEESYCFYLNPDRTPDPSVPGADMPEIFRLLLRYGLNPNAVFEGETVLSNVVYCRNGYAAADTVQVLLDHGADPLLLTEDLESDFDHLDIDIYFDSLEQKSRPSYDSMIHCWLVMIAHLHNRYKDREIITVYNNRPGPCDLPPFRVEDFREHRNYGYCLTRVHSEEKNWSLHIFDRRTGWEVARL